MHDNLPFPQMTLQYLFEKTTDLISTNAALKSEKTEAKQMFSDASASVQLLEQELKQVLISPFIIGSVKELGTSDVPGRSGHQFESEGEGRMAAYSYKSQQ